MKARDASTPTICNASLCVLCSVEGFEGVVEEGLLGGGETSPVTRCTARKERLMRERPISACWCECVSICCCRDGNSMVKRFSGILLQSK